MNSFALNVHIHGRCSYWNTTNHLQQAFEWEWERELSHLYGYGSIICVLPSINSTLNIHLHGNCVFWNCFGYDTHLFLQPLVPKSLNQTLNFHGSIQQYLDISCAKDDYDINKRPWCADFLVLCDAVWRLGNGWRDGWVGYLLPLLLLIDFRRSSFGKQKCRSYLIIGHSSLGICAD
jgi:hypothetical protein